MKPLKNYILVQQESNETRTASGLIIDAKPKLQLKGKVLAVGPDVKNISEGDIVHFLEVVHSGKSGDVPVFVISEDKVFASE